MDTKAKTRFDWIKSLTLEEMAEWYAEEDVADIASDETVSEEEYEKEYQEALKFRIEWLKEKRGV